MLQLREVETYSKYTASVRLAPAGTLRSDTVDDADEACHTAVGTGNGGPVDAVREVNEARLSGKACILDRTCGSHILNGCQLASGAHDGAEETNIGIPEGHGMALAVKGAGEGIRCGADTGPIGYVAQINICGQNALDVCAARRYRSSCWSVSDSCCSRKDSSCCCSACWTMRRIAASYILCLPGYAMTVSFQ